MGLKVQAFIQDKQTGKISYLTTCNAGGNVWRKKVYNSDAVKSLELTLLPVLINSYLRCAESDEELNALEKDIQILLQNSEWLTAQTGYTQQTLEGIFQNILKAINTARKVQGAVIIWKK
jgi:hypothetical protein